jgi:hypothetical protein
MAKLLFMGVRGSADPTNAAMPFTVVNGAVQAGHETQIVLANEAVDLTSGVIVENLMPFGWPPFKVILAETGGRWSSDPRLNSLLPCPWDIRSGPRGEGRGVHHSPKIADLLAWAGSTATF